MRSASAYPQVAGRSYLKFFGLCVVAFFAFSFFSDGPDNNREVPGMGGSRPATANLRAPAGWAHLSELLAVGLGLTEQAAQVIKDVKSGHKEDLKVKGVTKEGVDEPVTVADTNSNLVFVNGYKNHFSGINILSEETEPEYSDVSVEDPSLPPGLELTSDPSINLKDVLIIIDPLDATKEFGENLLEYVTTMVCVVYKGTPIAGIINQVFKDGNPPVVGVIPLEDEDTGVLFNRVKVSATGDAAFTVAISRSHTGEGSNVVEKYLDRRMSLLAGGSGYKSLLVVDGKAEAYIHVTNIKSWDVCAPEAVLKASGGSFSNVEGEALQYPMEYDSSHSQALFTQGIIASASAQEHKFFVESLGGNMS